MASSSTHTEIEVKMGDILSFEGDGFILPTNSYGVMSEGLAARVRRTTGTTVEKEITQSAPIAVGAAVVTSSGNLPSPKIIHVPVVEHPGMKAAIENVRRATRAGLLAANHFHLEQIAIPGIGFGENGIPHDEAARAMVDEIKAFRGNYPTRIVLMDTDNSMIHAFKYVAKHK